MANTVTITGPTFVNKSGTAFPTIPGLRSLAFWGSGYDNINTNRASGPAFSVQSGTPVYSSNCVSLGLQGGVATCIDSNVVMDAAQVTVGWTWATAFRTSATAVNILMGNQKPSGTGSVVQLTAAGSTRQLNIYSAGVKGTIQLVQPLSNWHLAALTYSGGTVNGTFTLYDLTEGVAPVTYVAATWGGGTQSFHWGASSIEAFGNQPNDQAFGLVASGAMNATDLNTLATSVRAFLGRRGITL